MADSNHNLLHFYWVNDEIAGALTVYVIDDLIEGKISDGNMLITSRFYHVSHKATGPQGPVLFGPGFPPSPSKVWTLESWFVLEQC